MAWNQNYPYRGVELLSPSIRSVIQDAYTPYCGIGRARYHLPEDPRDSRLLEAGLLRLGCTNRCARLDSEPGTTQARMNDRPARPAARGALTSFPALLWGLILVGVGLGVYALGVLIRFASLLLDPHDYLLPGLQKMVWYSGVPVVAGVMLAWSTSSSCCPGSGPGARSAGLALRTRTSRWC